MEKYLLEIIIASFGFSLTIIGTLLLSSFKNLSKNSNKMSTTMSEMNIKLEKVITDQTWHHREMKEAKERISSLENKG